MGFLKGVDVGCAACFSNNISGDWPYQENTSAYWPRSIEMRRVVLSCVKCLGRFASAGDKDKPAKRQKKQWERCWDWNGCDLCEIKSGDVAGCEVAGVAD